MATNSEITRPRPGGMTGAKPVDMLRRSWALASFLCAAALLAAPAHADDLDNPTRTGVALVSGAPIEGTLSKAVGFKAYEYAASKDGFVKITLATKTVRASDNGGRAWRPYLRVLRGGGSAEAWSSNGNQVDPSLGQSTMIFRVQKGDQLTVIASIALNNDKRGPAADATFTLTAKESQ